MNLPWKMPVKYALIIIVGLAMLVSADSLGLFFRFDNSCLDLFFRMRGQADTDRRILIVGVDERTLNRLGRWPLRRIYYTRLLEALGKADVIGFDIIMSEQTEDDAVLSRAIRGRGTVVLPTYIDRSTGMVDSSSAVSPLLTGHVHLEQDIDGVVRKIYHTLLTGGALIPSFSSCIYETLSGKPMRRETPINTSGVFKTGTGIIQTDLLNINFYGPPGTFPIIPLVDIIDGRYPSDFFSHKVILVGVTAEGLEGRVLTPFTQMRDQMTGVEVHANILNNLIDGTSIKGVTDTVRWIISICIALLVFLIIVRADNRWMPASWLSALIAVSLASFFLFARHDIWISPMFFCLFLSFLFIIVHIFNLETAGIKLKAAKEEWEDTFNILRDAVLLMDSGGGVIRSNKSTDLLEKGMLDFLSDGCRGANDGPSHKAEESANGLEKTVEIEGPVSGRQYEIRSLPRFHRKGDLIGFVHVVRDISEVRKAEAEKERIRFQLLQSQKMESIGRLAGGITHDFNNILTAILGFSELVLRKLSPQDPMRNNIQIIHDSGLKAAQLTRQLLAFSRKEELELQALDLAAVVNDMSKILARIIGEDVILKLFTSESVRHVKADTGHLEQVIMNLVVNARDAMPQGGSITIETFDVYLDTNYCRCNPGVTPGPFVALRISDSGMGMSRDVQSRIFEPFYTTKKAGEGTGLGLSTVYGIIKRLSGHIEVCSELGKGSVFTIYLPACDQERDTACESKEPGFKRGSDRILVAEDDCTIRYLIDAILEPLGYTVSLAASVEEALSLMETASTDYDILLTDVIMPESGGKELALAFQKRYPAAKVLFMSGYPIDFLSRAGLEPHKIAFIQKPIIPDRLCAKLREVLDQNT